MSPDPDLVGVVARAVAIGHDRLAALDPLDVSDRLGEALDLVGAARDQADDPFDALLVTDPMNIRALTGFTGSSARVVVFPSDAVLVTDGRYSERAVEELRTANCSASVVVEQTVSAQNTYLAETLKARGSKRLGLESAHVSWAELTSYDGLFDAQLVPVLGFVERLRRRKSDAELQRLGRASSIADAAFELVWRELANRPTEREFAVMLNDQMRRLGADDISFATIIASGPNGSRPHHEPGTRTVCHGDLVICDFGALVDGYHSDTTRTVSVGEPLRRQRAHLDVVLRSQQAGVAAVRAGVSGADVDAACREVLVSVGWEHFFTTGTGHGSGLAIHEEPWIGKNSVSVLAERDITTVEPGVYMPGVAGVRIEDSMVVTADGPQRLTCLPYDLVVE